MERGGLDDPTDQLSGTFDDFWAFYVDLLVDFAASGESLGKSALGVGISLVFLHGRRAAHFHNVVHFFPI